jgi:FAD/FMN-containing dehydrogenase
MNEFSQLVAHEPSSSLHTLYAKVKGRIVRPEHPDYDEQRALAHNNWDRRPALIVRVSDAEDVATALDYAQAGGLDIAVRSGGHSTCGHGASADGIVIDLRDLNTLEFAEDNSSVWAGAGLTAGQMTAAVEKHGVIVGFGDSATVGIGGLTVGGGIGYLVRKHGLTIDSLMAVELVTAAGDVLIADETSHPDLFWAVRGGGGNFGVVTRFKFRLHPLPEFTGGPLVLPATPEVLAGFVAAAEAAPVELSTIAFIMPAPPLPFLPAEAVGQKIILGMMAFAGPAEDAVKALAPFRALAQPLADFVGPAPYSAMYMPEDPSLREAVSIRSLFMKTLDVEEAAQMLDLLDQNDTPIRMVQVRVLGGAMADVPTDATAFAHRQSRIMSVFLAIGGLDTVERNEEWVNHCLRTSGQGVDGAYVNFVADEGADRLQDAYPAATWARLQQVKRRYDPRNVFRLNQNIPPAELNAA